MASTDSNGPSTWLWRQWRRSALYARFFTRRLARAMRYRLRLQHDEYPPLDALPQLVETPSPLLPAFQVAAGRALGRAYLWFDRAREHFLIERSRLRDRLSGPRLTAALIRQQMGLFVLVLSLVAVGLALDVLTARYGSHLRSVPGGAFLGRHLSAPSPATLETTLTATVTATGVVLGLVLTISLITFQTTASRYRSDRIITFLIREQVGSVVVRLLAAAFLYSLWLLFLRDVLTGDPPYASTAVAVALATAGIGSLIVYRLHALFALAPANVFAALEREARREFSRLARKSPGRSVEAHARRTIEADIEITKDLLATLVRESDWRAAAAGIAMVGRLLDSYLLFKRWIPKRSQWFRTAPVRLGPEAYAITLNFARRGRLPPTDMRPDHDWFEREIFDVASLVSAHGLADPALFEAVALLHGHALQLAWRAQEFEVLDRAFDVAESLATTAGVTSSASQTFLELPWVAVHDIARGLSPSLEEIVATRPWERSAAAALPRAARELADDLGRRVRKEIAITGEVVTPEAAMIAELRPRWEQLSSEKQSHYLARALALSTKHLHAVVDSRAESQAATAAETCLRIIVLAFAEGASPTIELDPLRRDLVDAYRLATAASERTQLREEGVWVAVRSFAERGEIELAVDLLEVATAMELFEPAKIPPASGATDTSAALRRYELLLQFAYAYGWAEYHSEVSLIVRIAPLVPSLFDLEALLPMLEKSHSALVWPFASGVKHRTWFQPLTMAIGDLPEIYVSEPGAFGFDVVRDHPSRLISEFADYGDVDDIVKAMVEHLVRASVQRRLIELIEHRIRKLDA